MSTAKVNADQMRTALEKKRQISQKMYEDELKRCMFQIKQASLSTTYIVYEISDQMNVFYNQRECLQHIKTKLEDDCGYYVKEFKNRVALFISWSENSLKKAQTKEEKRIRGEKEKGGGEGEGDGGDRNVQTIEIKPGCTRNRTHILATLLAAKK